VPSDVPTRTALLAAPLADLRPYWLELRCEPPCTHVVYAPFKLLGSRHGYRLTLQAVLQRLRCTHCQQRPRRAWVTDSPISPDGHHIAESASWRVEVLP